MARRICITVDRYNFNTKALKGNNWLFTELARAKQHNPRGTC